MINIGKMNNLTVKRETSSGYYLSNEEGIEEVFLPPALAPEDIEIGQKLEVFIYIDTKDNLIATSEIPYAVVGEYALLDLLDVVDFGAFFDLGIEKDLLVPANEQKIKIRQRDRGSYLVRICKEAGTDRVFGTTKFGKYLETCEFDISVGDKVEVVPVDTSELGYRVIINRKYLGLIYKNEIFSPIKIKEIYDGHVKNIRPDGFVDISLQRLGIKNLDDSKKVILDHLFKSGGRTHLHDKCSPEEIRRILGMSKKTFKNALGMLYKDKMVRLHKDGTELLHKKKVYTEPIK